MLREYVYGARLGNKQDVLQDGLSCLIIKQASKTSGQLPEMASKTSSTPLCLLACLLSCYIFLGRFPRQGLGRGRLICSLPCRYLILSYHHGAWGTQCMPEAYDLPRLNKLPNHKHTTPTLQALLLWLQITLAWLMITSNGQKFNALMRKENSTPCQDFV